MATTLYFRADAADIHRGTNTFKLDGNASGWLPCSLSTSRGAGAGDFQTPTVAGPTNGVEVTSGSGPREYISPPVSADVTISGTITANIWGREANMADNVAINVIIDILRANTFGTDNSNEIVNIVKSTRTTEMAQSASVNSVNNFTTGMTSGAYTGQTLHRGDRLRIRIFGDDAGTMGSGGQFTVSMGGTTGGINGDTYITFTETFSFESAPSGTTLYLTNEQSGLTYGTAVPALISDFTGSDENPLSEGGNWAQLDSAGSALQRISNAVSASAAAICGAYWTPGNFGPDVEAYMTYSAVGGTAQAILVRVQSEGGASTWDGYGVNYDGSNVAIRRYTNGGASNLIQVVMTVSAGDKLGISARGSTLQAWIQASGSSVWNMIATVDDTTYTGAGKIGILANNTGSRFDNLYAATDSSLFAPDAPVLLSNFTGADEDPLSEGGNWANLNSSISPLKRIGNEAAASVAAFCGSYWTPSNFGPDLEAYCTISTLATQTRIGARIQGEGGAGTWDGYTVVASSGSALIERVTNGTTTTLVSAAPSWASGDKLGIRLKGSTIQIWRQASGSSVWNLIATAVDALYASAGKLALLLNGTTTRIDNFYAATNSNLFTQQASLSRGSGVVSYISDTAAGWTVPLRTQEWFTRPLQAFTLTGLVQANLRLNASSTGASSARLEIAVVDADGTNPTIWGSWCIVPGSGVNGYILATGEAAYTAWISGDDLSVSDGQRLRIRIYLDDPTTSAMTDSQTVTAYYNGTSGGASGDSYVILAQTVSELVLLPFRPKLIGPSSAATVAATR